MSRAHGTLLNLQYDVSDRNGDNMASPLLSMEATETKTTRLGFIAGTILEDKKMSFERILFRATRGNMFLKVVRPDAAEGGRIVRLPCTLPLPPSGVGVCVCGVTDRARYLASEIDERRFAHRSNTYAISSAES